MPPAPLTSAQPCSAHLTNKKLLPVSFPKSFHFSNVAFLSRRDFLRKYAQTHCIYAIAVVDTVDQVLGAEPRLRHSAVGCGGAVFIVGGSNRVYIVYSTSYIV